MFALQQQCFHGSLECDRGAYFGFGDAVVADGEVEFVIEVVGPDYSVGGESKTAI